MEPCFAYRFRRNEETEEEYGARAAASLEAEILRHPPGTVAAFLAETVVGATAGSVPPVAGYFRRIREICDRHGVLLILDEVMCGLGRCGALHACLEEGVAPDILVVAKGLGAGVQPLGAMLVHGRIVRAIATGSGRLRARADLCRAPGCLCRRPCRAAGDPGGGAGRTLGQ
ncbi:MAG: aminotransferase class III-fold pyridoxal phosphate-dependent enzyme [Acetobacteraceae bacterium]|nr:aminotransferase class III-fold pyridoxal phosphate-dependent enzyme [Acetobacteraceae bacterium]